MDTITHVEVTRVAAERYQISWDECFTTEPVTIFAGADPLAIERANPCIEGAHQQATFAAPDAPTRCYFLLVPATDEPLIVAERPVEMHGGVNFRDVGGYRTEDGRRVRWGRLFRSGHMSKLTAADKQTFAALNISTVCDFRIDEERAHENTELPGAPAVHTLDIMPGIGDAHFFHRLFASADGPSEVVDAVHQMLETLVREAAPCYAGLFEALLEDPSGALLMNCSAGKERTGVGTALVLSALGVPRETIGYDFMLSGTFFPAAAEVPRVLEKYAVTRPGETGRALIWPLLDTRLSYLEAAFAAIDADFGSSAEFLRQNYGLDAHAVKRLRDLYTN
jgi:protein-tyrosine phosphatase